MSFAPVLVRVIDAGPAMVGLMRMAVGTAGLVALLAWRRRRREAPVSGRAVAWAAGGGLLLAIDLFLWHQGIGIIGVGPATVLVNTQVFWVAALSRVLLGEPLSPWVALCAVGAVAGVALLSGADLTAAALDPRGVALSLGASASYAGYLFCLRQSLRREGALDTVANLAVVTAAAAVGLAVVAAGHGEPWPMPDWHNIAGVLGLGLVVHIGAWLLISRGLPHLPSARGALTLLIQPALATVWGVLLFAEGMGPARGGGVALTLASVYLANRVMGRG